MRNLELPIHGLPFKKEMPFAVEVFVAMRELVAADAPGHDWRYGTFRWKKWRDACDAVMRPSKFARAQGSFNMTVCNMLRAQVKAGYIVRLKRGLYQFRSSSPASPLYVTAGQFSLDKERLEKSIYQRYQRTL